MSSGNLDGPRTSVRPISILLMGLCLPAYLLLSGCGGKEIAKELQGLKSSSEDERVKALLHLAQMKEAGEAAVPAALKCLEDSSAKVRKMAVQCLQAFGERAKVAIPNLVTVGEEDTDPGVRKVAGLLLRELGEKEDAANVFASLLESDDVDVRMNAAMHLAEMGKEAASARDAAVAGLKNDSADVKMYCAQFLGKLGDASPQVIESLKPLLKDSTDFVQNAAKEALKQLGQ